MLAGEATFSTFTTIRQNHKHQVTPSDSPSFSSVILAYLRASHSDGWSKKDIQLVLLNLRINDRLKVFFFLKF